jgi:hypothetical protein
MSGEVLGSKIAEVTFRQRFASKRRRLAGKGRFHRLLDASKPHRIPGTQT